MKKLFCFAFYITLFSITSNYPQWIQQTLPGDIDVTLGIDFINQNRGIMGGWHFNFAGQIFGNAFYTTDSGANWIEASIPDSMRVIVGTQMFTYLAAYGAGAYNITTAQSSTTSNGNQNLSPFRSFQGRKNIVVTLLKQQTVD